MQGILLDKVLRVTKVATLLFHQITHGPHSGPGMRLSSTDVHVTSRSLVVLVAGALAGAAPSLFALHQLEGKHPCHE